MKILPTPERIRAAASSGTDQGLGQGAEIAIALTMFCAIGQLLRLWHGYDARMRNLEADLARGATAHQHAGGEGRA
ncbi:MAG: hypothetical protein ACKO3L_11430 [Actinomycetota bacterium]